MKGILGKKLGMSQVFDPDSGAMTAVTVIQAGPCPVVQIKTADADGYDAVQLAFEEVAERKLSENWQWVTGSRWLVPRAMSGARC